MWRPEKEGISQEAHLPRLPGAERRVDGVGTSEQMMPPDCLEYADRRIKAFKKTKSRSLNKTGNDTQFQTFSFCPRPLFSAKKNAFPIEGAVQVALWAPGGVSAAIICPPHVP